MIINMDFEFNQHVWFVTSRWQKYFVVEGNIYGFTILNKEKGIQTLAIFKSDSVPVDQVFSNKTDAIKKANELNGIKE